jgi:hypothetical protein
MDNKMVWNEKGEFESPGSGNGKSPEWPRVDEVLFNTIQNSSSGFFEDGEQCAEIDEDFDGEEAYEDAEEQFSSSVRVLTTMDPRQAALFIAKPSNR